LGGPGGGVGIDLGGRGRITLDPDLVPIPAEPSDVDLGAVELGADASGSFFIGNVGDADLTVSGIALRAGSFYGDQITLPFVVAPGEWREIAVHTGTGGTTRPGDVLTGEWSVLSDDPANPDVRVLMRVRVSGPRLERDGSDFIDFGPVAAGTPASRTMVLRNTGDRDVTLDAAKWTSGSPFVLTLPAGTALPTSLAPSAALSMTVSVAMGTGTGVFVDYLTVGARRNFPDRLVTGFRVQVY
jgi:hypothetical protein